ncbi:MAG: reverse transcriptase domain-containing protein [Candidatus Melainabacteria bacterium]
MFQLWLKEKGLRKVVDVFDDYLEKKPNGRAPGLDKQAFSKYRDDRDFLIKEAQIIFNKLTDRPKPRYVFTPFLQTHIPKEKSKPLSEDNSRPIAQATIRDSIVQMILLEYFEKKSGVRFVKTSYAYQRGKSPLKAAQAVRTAVNDGYVWVYDADLSKFFDTIPHNLLLSKISERFPSDDAFLKLIEKFLKTKIRPIEKFSAREVQAIRGKVRSGKYCRVRDIDNPNVGIPQGGILSGYLANLFLHEFDLKFTKHELFRYVRYADDFVVMGKSEKDIRSIETWIESELQALGVTLNKKKTEIRCERDYPEISHKPGFAFVGFVFRNGTILAKQKNIERFVEKIRTLVLYEKTTETERRKAKYKYDLYKYSDNCFRLMGQPPSRYENKGIYLSSKQWLSQLAFKYYLDEVLEFFTEKFDEQGVLVQYSWLSYFHMINDPAQINYLTSIYKETLKAFFCLRFGWRPSDEIIGGYSNYKSFYKIFYGFVESKKRRNYVEVGCIEV